MSEITKRRRETADQGNGEHWPEEVLLDAADEIERLTTERDALMVCFKASEPHIRVLESEAAELRARVAELEDKVDGLTADLDEAVAVAIKRGAHEWAQFNYPDHASLKVPT